MKNEVKRDPTHRSNCFCNTCTEARQYYAEKYANRDVDHKLNGILNEAENKIQSHLLFTSKISATDTLDIMTKISNLFVEIRQDNLTHRK